MTFVSQVTAHTFHLSTGVGRFRIHLWQFSWDTTAQGTNLALHTGLQDTTWVSVRHMPHSLFPR